MGLFSVSFIWVFLKGISAFLYTFFFCVWTFLWLFDSEGALNLLPTSSIVFELGAIKCSFKSILWRRGRLRSLDLVRLWATLILYVFFLGSCFMQFSYSNLISLVFWSYFLYDSAYLSVSPRLPWSPLWICGLCGHIPEVSWGKWPKCSLSEKFFFQVWWPCFKKQP